MKIIKIADMFRSVDQECEKRGLSSIELLCKLVGVNSSDIEGTLDSIEITRSKVSRAYMKLSEENRKETFKDYDFIMESFELIKSAIEEYKKNPENPMFSKIPSSILLEIKKSRAELASIVRKLDEDFFNKYFSPSSKFDINVEVISTTSRKELFKGRKIDVETYSTAGTIRNLTIKTPKKLLGDFFMVHSAPNLASPTYVHIGLKTDIKKWQKEDILTFDYPVQIQEFLESINSNKSKKKKKTIEAEDTIMSVLRYLNEIGEFNIHDVIVLPWAVKKEIVNGKIKLEYTIAGKFYAHQVKKEENVFRDAKLKFNLIRLSKALKNPVSNKEVQVWIISKDLPN